jgi:hypothetical protein
MALQGLALKQAVVASLEKMEELLKIGWCKTWALNDKDQSVEPQDESACKWCYEGAAIAATIHIHGEQDPDTGKLIDTEEARQVRQIAIGLTQLAEQGMAEQMRNQHRKIMAGQTLGATRIHPASVIPANNDKSGQSQEQVISWTRKARIAAEFIKWD